MGARDWYVPLAGDAPVRLFGFPHAGSGTARLVGLARALTPTIGVWAANLPGRQARLEEPVRADLDELVAELTDEITELARPPYALFGYCSGALTAFLVARQLRDRGAPAPQALVVASFEAPDIAYRPRRLAALPSARLWESLIAEGGVPSDISAEGRLRWLVEPAVRADFTMLANYQHRPAPALPYPVAVCFGDSDQTPRGSWLGWRRQTTQPPRLLALPGGHWLLDDTVEELAEALHALLLPGVKAPPTATAPAHQSAR